MTKRRDLEPRHPAWTLAATLLLLIPLAAASAQQDDDVFFDSDFDGGWVGTITSGKDRIPFQLNLNVEGKGAIGFLILGDQADGGPTSLEVFAVELTKPPGKKVILRIDDTSPLRVGSPARGFRFGSATLKLSYKSATDSLAGKSSGSIKGKVAATRMAPTLPMQRLWQGNFKTGGQTLFAQLATTEDEDGVIGGHATFGSETSTVVGEHKGNNVDMTFDLDGQAIEFSGKLKTKNNKLKGTFDSEGESNKATLVPADGNGKPMKFSKVKKLAAIDLDAGQSKTVQIAGKNIALGALAYADSTDVRVTAVELTSAKALSVTLATDANAVEGTAIALRLFNGDGETADKANVLNVSGGGGGDLVDFAAQIQPIFTNSCALSGCHSSGSAQAGMVLASGSAIANIVGVPSSEQPALQRVEPGNPDDSYLVRKIEGGPGITGGQMPLNRTPLAQSQIDLIRLWITQGANARRR